MYKSHFHLSRSIRSPAARTAVSLHDAAHAGALATLEYGISAHKGFIVLTGEVGTGKTTLLRRALASARPERVFSSFVFNPRLDVLDFLEFILSDFGITPQNRTKSGMLIQLNRWLIERYRRDETCVIIVDEAQNLEWELLEEIRLLTNLETTSEKLVQIVLSGQPGFDREAACARCPQASPAHCAVGTDPRHFVRADLELHCAARLLDRGDVRAHLPRRGCCGNSSRQPRHTPHHQSDLRARTDSGL